MVFPEAAILSLQSCKFCWKGSRERKKSEKSHLRVSVSCDSDGVELQEFVPFYEDVSVESGTLACSAAKWLKVHWGEKNSQVRYEVTSESFVSGPVVLRAIGCFWHHFMTMLLVTQVISEKRISGLSSSGWSQKPFVCFPISEGMALALHQVVIDKTAVWRALCTKLPISQELLFQSGQTWYLQKAEDVSFLQVSRLSRLKQ